MMDELLAAAAEAMGIPPAMVERSAEARAKASGQSVEEILRAWAGGGSVEATAPVEEATAPDEDAVPDDTVPEEPAAEPLAPPDSSQPAPAAPPAPASGGMDRNAMVSAAADKLRMPESMVRRSLAARSKESGRAEDEILREWVGAGSDAVPAPGSVTPAPPPVQTPEAETPVVEPEPGPSAEAAPAPAAAPVDEAALVAAAAEKMGMPESMVKRSAAARSKAQNISVQAVLAEWAGVEAPAEGGGPAPSEAAAPAAEAPAAQPAPRSAPAGAPVDEDALLSAAAEKMGMPESMVKRSAAARSKAENVSVEAVLAEWAGVEAPAAGAAAATEAEAPAAAPAAQPAPVVEEPEEADVEVLGETEPAEPAPASRRREENMESEEEAVAAGALPRWLAALFVFVPAFAIAYALFLPNGPNCGDAGRLAVDPVSGVAVNCDLSEFGEEVADFFAIGTEVYNGIGCVACHGAGGGGVASFPAFTGGALLTTFPEGSCDAQIEWISLGSAGWPEPTYGANEKPVGGSGAVMPGFATSLDPDEIAAVALYERVAFGGQDLDAAIEDCGLVDGGEEE